MTANKNKSRKRKTPDKTGTKKIPFKKIFNALAPEHNPTLLGKASTRDPFYQLCATILSQRTRDANTERTAAALMAAYPSPEALSRAPLGKIEKLIYASGFYKAKARNLRAAAREILERFGGKVPDNMEDLVSLPGVGRKTAGCVLVYAFGVPAIPVDTHVHRIANRLGWVKTSDPLKTELALMEVVPERYWTTVNEYLVDHGKVFCPSRNPRCAECPIERFCEKVDVSMKTTKRV